MNSYYFQNTDFSYDYKIVNVNKPRRKIIMKKAKIEALVIFDDTVWREFS